MGLTIAPDGFLYVADTRNGRIREVWSGQAAAPTVTVSSADPNETLINPNGLSTTWQNNSDTVHGIVDPGTLPVSVYGVPICASSNYTVTATNSAGTTTGPSQPPHLLIRNERNSAPAR